VLKRGELADEGYRLWIWLLVYNCTVAMRVTCFWKLDDLDIWKLFFFIQRSSTVSGCIGVTVTSSIKNVAEYRILTHSADSNDKLTSNLNPRLSLRHSYCAYLF